MSAADQRLKLFAKYVMLKEAVTETHKRLEADLDGWAQAKGYDHLCGGFEDGTKPDVLRSDASRQYYFIGDAKNSANEGARCSETRKRISAYLENFGQLLCKGVKGGTIAIATDSAEEADRWKISLLVLSWWAGINGPGNSAPAFSVEKLPEKNTWIIYW